MLILSPTNFVIWCVVYIYIDSRDYDLICDQQFIILFVFNCQMVCNADLYFP